jgi:hypothetical protein
LAICDCLGLSGSTSLPDFWLVGVGAPGGGVGPLAVDAALARGGGRGLLGVAAPEPEPEPAAAGRESVVLAAPSSGLLILATVEVLIALECVGLRGGGLTPVEAALEEAVEVEEAVEEEEAAAEAVAPDAAAEEEEGEEEEEDEEESAFECWVSCVE